MKKIIKKNPEPVILGVLIAAYEASDWFFKLDFIPLKAKIAVGIVAGIGYVAKIYLSKKNENNY